jgi:protein-S-isoprenylcysteine O-methyltransferase Ste14
MMTGAILVLAHAILYGVYLLTTMGAVDNGDRDWIQWYSWWLAGIGLAFLIWGFVRDIEVTVERARRKQAKAARRAAEDQAEAGDA